MDPDASRRPLTDMSAADYSVEEAMKIVFSGGIVLPYVSRIKSDPRHVAGKGSR